MHETCGYLGFVVDVAEKHLSQPSEECKPKVIVRLAEKALCIMKRWNKLQRKVKYWESILSIFSKPWQTLQIFDMASGIIWFASCHTSTKNICLFEGICRNDFLDCITATLDTLVHPFPIEFELCLRDTWHHFLLLNHLWARVDLDPATFTSFLPSPSRPEWKFNIIAVKVD